VWDGVIALPLFGVIDDALGQQACQALLDAVVRTRARSAIIDLTGVYTIDALAGNNILSMARGAQLLGARCVVVGIGPAIARTIATVGLDLSALVTRSNLREALLLCIREDGAAGRSPRSWS